MPVNDGSIIATIITSHIPMKEAVAPSHVCVGILIHAIDMVQPPGIAMPPAIEPHHQVVAPALAMNNSALVARRVDSTCASESTVSNAGGMNVFTAERRAFTARTYRGAGPTPG